MNELTFDYDALPKKDIQFVKQTTREVNLLLERSTGDIITIGQKLIEMKNRLGHGQWRAWLRKNGAGTGVPLPRGAGRGARRVRHV